MDSFWGFLKIAFICITVLFAIFLVLLALPKSQLRSIILEIFGWSVSAGSAALVVSPVDIIPDILVGAGWIDDIGYIVMIIISALFAYSQRKQRQQLN